MSTTRIQEGERCVLKLAGDLDSPACLELARRVALEPSQEVLLDFFEVERIDDRSLGNLADAIMARPRVALRGLCDHQLRVLAYLGVESAKVAFHH